MSVSGLSLPRMEGELFCFHQDQFSKRVGFRSGSKAHKRHVVLVGGLSDGLLPVPYTQQLGQALDSKGWALVQVLLSSSYTGFGHVRLDDDARELEQLMHYLQEEGSQALGIVGHSTGCQDAVYYLKQHHAQDRLKFIALQAPVSDRESMELMLGKDKMAQLVSIARAFKEEGNGHEMMPRGAFWAPITAQRFLDLATKEGLDDMFSSDLTPEELSQRLGHVNVPTLLAFSAKDEYVPPSVDVPQLAARMKAAMPHAQPCTITHIEGAGHALKGHEDQFVAQLIDFMTPAGLITT